MYPGSISQIQAAISSSGIAMQAELRSAFETLCSDDLVLIGPIGAGKTVLAHMILDQIRREKPDAEIHLFRCDTLDDLKADFMALGKLRGWLLEGTPTSLQALAQVRKNVGELPSCYLLFDNAETHESLRNYLPASSGARCLVTSTSEAWTFPKKLVLKGMCPEDMRLLLLDTLRGTVEESFCQAFVKELDGHPHAAVIAVKTMTDMKITVGKYLQMFAAPHTLPHFVQYDSKFGVPEPLWTVAAIAFSALSESACSVLYALAYISSTSTPSELCRAFLAGRGLEKEFETAMVQLASLALVSLPTPDTVLVGSGVQRCVRELLVRQNVTNVLNEVVVALGRLFKTSDHLEFVCTERLELRRAVFSHICSLSKWMQPDTLNSFPAGNLFFQASRWCLRVLGDVKRAKELVEVVDFCLQHMPFGRYRNAYPELWAPDRANGRIATCLAACARGLFDALDSGTDSTESIISHDLFQLAKLAGDIDEPGLERVCMMNVLQGPILRLQKLVFVAQKPLDAALTKTVVSEISTAIETSQDLAADFIANLHTAKAFLYLNLKEYHASIAEATTALAMVHSSLGSGHFDAGINHEVIALACASLQETDEALCALKRALDNRRFRDDLTSDVPSLKRIAEVYRILNMQREEGFITQHADKFTGEALQASKWDTFSREKTNSNLAIILVRLAQHQLATSQSGQLAVDEFVIAWGLVFQAPTADVLASMWLDYGRMLLKYGLFTHFESVVQGLAKTIEALKPANLRSEFESAHLWLMQKVAAALAQAKRFEQACAFGSFVISLHRAVNALTPTIEAQLRELMADCYGHRGLLKAQAKELAQCFTIHKEISGWSDKTLEICERHGAVALALQEFDDALDSIDAAAYRYQERCNQSWESRLEMSAANCRRISAEIHLWTLVNVSRGGRGALSFTRTAGVLDQMIYGMQASFLLNAESIPLLRISQQDALMALPEFWFPVSEAVSSSWTPLHVMHYADKFYLLNGERAALESVMSLTPSQQLNTFKGRRFLITVTFRKVVVITDIELEFAGSSYSPVQVKLFFNIENPLMALSSEPAYEIDKSVHIRTPIAARYGKEVSHVTIFAQGNINQMYETKITKIRLHGRPLQTPEPSLRDGLRDAPYMKQTDAEFLEMRQYCAKLVDEIKASPDDVSRRTVSRTSEEMVAMRGLDVLLYSFGFKEAPNETLTCDMNANFDGMLDYLCSIEVKREERRRMGVHTFHF
eukprot:TRINITY_DN6010_c0_g1_i3.p1 TRINITY_DN6010_c0_g1~~TRINITY_DN6010_c0_g1_i3.p1  ORF type:complete len:1228 (+),score=203.80 TRINITY_DN6010_c0_g1_i3:62-3745(+)